MRLTLCKNRWFQVALIAAWVIAGGCQRLPYIDQTKPVPHDSLGRVALEDKEVKQADLLSSTLPMPLPKLAKPRTTNDPEAQEVWPMTLQQAIRIGLDNSEIVRVIAFGAQGIPIGGFEPTPLEYRCERGRRQLLGCGHPSVGLRSRDPGDPDRLRAFHVRHRLHHQPALGQEHHPLQQRRSRWFAQFDRHQVPRRLVERFRDVPDGSVEADRDRCDTGCRP